MSERVQQQKKTAKLIYCRPDTRQLLERMASKETRSLVDQLAIVIHEAAVRRGLLAAG